MAKVIEEVKEVPEDEPLEKVPKKRWQKRKKIGRSLH